MWWEHERRKLDRKEKEDKQWNGGQRKVETEEKSKFNSRWEQSDKKRAVMRRRTGWSNQAPRWEQRIITFIICGGTDKGNGGVPDVGVPLHVEVMKVVGALSSTKVRPLQPLDDFSFHHSGYVCRQQGQQQALLDRQRHNNSMSLYLYRTPGSNVAEELKVCIKSRLQALSSPHRFLRRFYESYAYVYVASSTFG